jgi:hypothetical protein
MLNKVILLWIIKCYLLVAECRRETNSGWDPERDKCDGVKEDGR